MKEFNEMTFEEQLETINQHFREIFEIIEESADITEQKMEGFKSRISNLILHIFECKFYEGVDYKTTGDLKLRKVST